MGPEEEHRYVDHLWPARLWAIMYVHNCTYILCVLFWACSVPFSLFSGCPGIESVSLA